VLPRALSAWLERVLGAGEVVISVAAMRGATSSMLLRVPTATSGGHGRDLVLRWYPDDRVLGSEPQAVAREADALEAVATTAVPAPRLVAWTNPEGPLPGAVLMTFVPGVPAFDLPDPAAVRDVLSAIHAVVPEAAFAVHRYRGYHEDADLRRPSWWRDSAMWERVVRQTTTARPTGPDTFIHRDFHPANVLWVGGRLTGVVDWVNACVGPAGVDVAHCRVNLATLWGPETADRRLPGDPAWDIEAALGLFDFDEERPSDWQDSGLTALADLGAPVVDVPTARRRLEEFMSRALAELG